MPWQHLCTVTEREPVLHRGIDLWSHQGCPISDSHAVVPSPRSAQRELRLRAYDARDADGRTFRFAVDESSVGVYDFFVDDTCTQHVDL